MLNEGGILNQLGCNLFNIQALLWLSQFQIELVLPLLVTAVWSRVCDCTGLVF